MGKIFSNLKPGDKVYYFCFDNIEEFTVENKVSGNDKGFSKEFNFPLSIHLCEGGVLPVSAVDMEKEVLHPFVVLSGKYFGIYATSKKAIGKYLKEMYDYEIQDRKKIIENSDYRIERAKEQLNKFNKISC